MDKDPETLEEALYGLKAWKSAYIAKLLEVEELNAEITRLNRQLAQDDDSRKE